MAAAPRRLSLEDVLQTIRDYMDENFPDEPVRRVILHFGDGRRIDQAMPRAPRTATPAPGPASAAAPPVLPPFEPNEMQAAILESLAGVAMRTDALADATGYNRCSLFRKPGGVAELQEQGLICHSKAAGYYRPDAPPENLSNFE